MNMTIPMVTILKYCSTSIFLMVSVLKCTIIKAVYQDVAKSRWMGKTISVFLAKVLFNRWFKMSRSHILDRW